ncbi:hypothetical protein NQ317_003421 [Molorchus minor]|uniref:Protein MCM10 homolog n=1 Tax=Molorchus minor TaxID=1323400 RepID=A0ABQ9JTP6_9CUCU|nr:hypothetical protein NQ317_003421 [Molorchus minor]
MSHEDNLLDNLLSVATQELENLNKKENVLRETDIFKIENSLPLESKLDRIPSSSIIHNGDTDSSDDEGNRNYEDRKYSDYGREIKHLLEDQSSPFSPQCSQSDSSSWKKKGIFASALESRDKLLKKIIGHYAQGSNKDKDWVIAGVIVKKSAVKTSQKGSQFCIWTLSDLKDDIKTVALFLFSSAYKQLWKTSVGMVVGVLNPNVLDRKDNSKDEFPAKEEACLSVDNAQKVMICGQAKDFGTCKSIKKDGEKCTAIVNLSRCEFCIYHIKQEYQKCSKRSELQANFAGKGLLALRNKVLGKNEVFYAGKSYMAIPAKHNKKMELKDNNRLKSLTGKGVIVNSNHTTRNNNKNLTVKKQNASRLEVTHAQRLRDMELLKKIIKLKEKQKENCSNTVSSVVNSYNMKSDLIKEGIASNFNEKISDVTSEESRAIACDVILKLKSRNKNNRTQPTDIESADIFSSNINLHYDDLNLPSSSNIQFENNTVSLHNSANILTSKENTTAKSINSVGLQIPALSGGEMNSLIDLNLPITSKHIDKAKLNAIKVIKKIGPIKKADPNSIKGTIRKRHIEIEENSATEHVAKKTTSKHIDLLESRDDEEKEKYFSNMERKEQMEEKMTNTFKVPCKAVKCIKCKYTSFSASDICKTEKHPLKVFDAFKRFFKCGNCGNRVVSLDIVPIIMCKNCGSGKWERTGMMKEKISTAAHSLSIRGGEQKSVKNSMKSVANYYQEASYSWKKRHAAIYKRVKSLLPRRESERRAHPLSRHCDILQAVETRISMLNMTYIKYIESSLLCFIPGKVLDEMKAVLALVESDQTPPRTHQLLQELRDLSSMAMEHFDEHILPKIKEQIDRRTGRAFQYDGLMASCSKAPKIIYSQHVLSSELHKVKKQSKTHKHHISYLTQSTQKLCQKILEQEATLADIKKHLDEWDQKYNDLTAELVRARDDILSSTHSTHSLSTPSSQTSSSSKFYKTNIKPRMAHILPKSYLSIQFDLERKRKSNLLPDIPLKRNRTPENDDKNQCKDEINLNIPDLIDFKSKQD